MKNHQLCSRLFVSGTLMLVVLIGVWKVRGQTSKNPDSKSYGSLGIRVVDGSILCPIPIQTTASWEGLREFLKTQSYSPQSIATASDVSAKKSVIEFLNDWLVLKDDVKTMNSFSKEAFENRAILGDDCAGYIREEVRSDARAVKSGVRKFLNDISSKVAASKLDDMLTIEKGKALMHGNKAEVLNTPDKDKFWLFRFTPEFLAQLGGLPADDNYVKHKVKGKNAVVSCIQLHLKIDGELTKGTFYFLWTQEKTGWKIFHVGMICQ